MKFFSELSIAHSGSEKFLISELLLIAEIADSKAEAKRLVKQGFTIWVDFFNEVPTNEDSTSFDRCKKFKGDTIELRGGDTVIFGKSKDGARLKIRSPKIQNSRDWEKVLQSAA